MDPFTIDFVVVVVVGLLLVLPRVCRDLIHTPLASTSGFLRTWRLKRCVYVVRDDTLKCRLKNKENNNKNHQVGEVCLKYFIDLNFRGREVKDNSFFVFVFFIHILLVISVMSTGEVYARPPPT